MPDSSLGGDDVQVQPSPRVELSQTGTGHGVRPQRLHRQHHLQCWGHRTGNPVFNFTDAADPNGPPSDFTAVVDLGDGNVILVGSQGIIDLDGVTAIIEPDGTNLAVQIDDPAATPGQALGRYGDRDRWQHY